MKKIDIYRERKNLRLSQCELAKKSGVSRFKIGMHELGYRRLNAHDYQALINTLRLERMQFTK